MGLRCFFLFTVPRLFCCYSFCRLFSLFSWKINIKNLHRTAANLLRCFFKVCSYALIYLLFGFVQAKTLSLVIAIITILILFIFCVQVRLGCVLPLVKKEDINLLLLLFFRRSLPSLLEGENRLSIFKTSIG